MDNINIDSRIEKIECKAEKMNLTYFKDSDGKHCVCDVDWIGRFDTLEELEKFLNL